MAQYGVGTSNSFGVLDEDAPAVKVTPSESQPVVKQPSTSPVATAVPSKDARTLDAPTKRGARVPRGRGRGRGFGNRAPRRIFERHSGTGRGKEVRKGGYGGYDAEGTMQDDLKSEEVTMELAAEDAIKPAAEQGPPAEEPQPPAPETEEEKKAREEKEKEDSQITYDQYLERQKKKAVEDDSKVQIRQVQNDDKKFKACKQLEKDDDNDYADVLVSDKKEADDGKKKNDKKSKKSKHLDEFNAEGAGNNASAQASAPNAEYRGRGRGGYRGGGRGRGAGRGGFRGGRGGAAPSTQQVNIQDEAAFPKLGK